MGRKVHRVPVNLDADGVDALPFDDVKVILRGADELIAQGGRSLLVQILKGSRRKRLLELGLDRSPVFGYYRHLKEHEILARIDWVILNRYLRIEYDNRLPLLVFTPIGWDIEKNTYTDELVGVLEEAATDETKKYDVSELKDRNREMILMLLDKLRDTGNPQLIPLLEAWAKVDYKKVKRRILKVMDSLRRARA